MLIPTHKNRRFLSKGCYQAKRNNSIIALPSLNNLKIAAAKLITDILSSQFSINNPNAYLNVHLVKDEGFLV